MANEIQIAHTSTGVTLYAIAHAANADALNLTLSAPEAYTTANLADYAIALAELGTASQYYAGSFPSFATSGVYQVAIYQQIGGSPVEGDTLVGLVTIPWNGAALVSVVNAIANDPATHTEQVYIEAQIDDVRSRLPGALSGGNIKAEVLALSVAGAGAVADALLDRAAGVETGFTVRQSLRLLLAALAGKISGAGTTTITLRAATDAKDRITATVDNDGNRTALTLDAS